MILIPALLPQDRLAAVPVTFPEASRLQEGLALINSMHITSPVFIKDDESGLHENDMVTR